MIDIDLPVLQMRPISLSRDQEATRGPDDPDAAPPGRVLVGGPLVVPVTTDHVAGDPDLALFVAREADRWSYHLAHVAATFESAPGDAPFESALVELLFGARDGAAPIAWSMQPQRVTDTGTRSTTWRLGPELSIFDIGVSLGSVEHTRSRAVAEVFIEALRPLRADPAWRLRRTASQHIDGAHRFVMVVRRPRGVDASVTLSVQAFVRRRRLLRFRNTPLSPVVLSGPL